MDLGKDAGKWPISYRVVYHRVDQLKGNDESRAVVLGEIEPSAGTQPALPVQP